MRATFVRIDDLSERPQVPVVVIDVLRAFTTAAWILSGGAERLVLAESVDEALRLKKFMGPGALALQDGPLTPGFDLGNSPGQVRVAPLRGRPVIQRTNNGTVGVYAARHAPLVLCAALNNASATARRLVATGAEDVTYVVTGDQGRADEDLACGEYIHAMVVGSPPPADVEARVWNSRSAAAIGLGVSEGFPGIHPEDVRLGATLDLFDFAMVAREVDSWMELSVEEAAAS